MRAVLCGVVVAGAAMLAHPAALPAGARQQQQRPPVFRAGATYVSVDAYPEMNGRIVEGLTRDDLEVFEDGKRQSIETFEFIKADAPLPDDDRNTHLSAREGLELAADPRYRVIVIVLDRGVFDSLAWRATRDALLTYLRTESEPRDLLALITTDDSWEDLVLGRRLTTIESELEDPEWLRPRPQELTAALAACNLPGMRGRIRADATYGLLEGVVRLLGQVREDRTSVLFVSTSLSRMGKSDRNMMRRGLGPAPTGLVNGRIQAVRSGSDLNERFCRQEAQRLADTDFNRRFDELTRQARAANVAFYPVPVTFFQPAIGPLAMGANAAAARGSGFVPGRRMMIRTRDAFAPLAKDTGGVLVPRPGDVITSLRRIAGDTGSHYLLRYSTTNSKRDGKMRTITVRMKSSGKEIRARRQYRAPSAEDIEDLSRPIGPTRRVVPEAIVNALEPLKSVQPSAQFHAYGAVAGSALNVTVEVPPLAVENGRWPDGAALDVMAESADGKTVGMARGRLAPNGRAVVAVPLGTELRPALLLVRLRADGESITQRVPIVGNPSSLVGDPSVFRSSVRALNIPAALFVFSRDERVKVDWPIKRTLDSYEARLLDRFGLPLKYKVNMRELEVGQGRRLVAELPLAPLGRGDYVIELTAATAALTETRLLALRVR